MRIFAFILICLLSMTLNAQNCQKVILSQSSTYHDFTYEDLSSSMVSSTLNRQKREYLQKLIRPLFKDLSNEQFIIYLKENKGVYTAKGKSSNSENVMKIEKVEKYKNNIYFLYIDDSKLYLDLNLKIAFDLSKGNKYDVNLSLCEF